MRISVLILSLLMALFTTSPLGAQELVDPTAARTLPADEDGFDEIFLVTPDPLEPFNRAMFWVNDKLYFYLLKPVARTYRVVPEPARASVGNFFSNVATPVRLANCLLQFRFIDAGREVGRFAVNTTWGIGGLFDPARQRLGWQKKDEDLGQTLGYFGIPAGPYLVLPVFGPSNPRDAVGRFGDGYLDPWPYVLDETWEVVAVKTYERINWLSLDRDTYEAIKREQLDPYVYIREAYTQRREALILE
ncbi:phospholipid-binding lipoprotein MlaA [Geoalkalibacter ferrihydriticus]|uniref:Phospholipid-binding lipoprotein MlaA n=1 Tax=Geoalkalibacter ferrihydriticus TaxID=392333 RepID=A0A1G9JHA0_9BACT|nr:VacJ family lipoprotein [Geoalkalibacter ferrihydriticus]SDL36546.1 phospholipid-binding lipoprotein MlaA [Geoalkalibacter ferrihydriticus]